MELDSLDSCPQCNRPKYFEDHEEIDLSEFEAFCDCEN